MSKSLEWGIIFIFSMAAYTAAMATWFCPFWFLKPIFLGLFILCCIPIVEEIKELRIWK